MGSPEVGRHMGSVLTVQDEDMVFAIASGAWFCRANAVGLVHCLALLHCHRYLALSPVFAECANPGHRASVC